MTLVFIKEIQMEAFEKNFENTADMYDKVRPIYCTEIFEDIFKYQAINTESQVCEVGIGSGKATLPFLQTQCSLDGIEPGERLAQFTREKYQNYENLRLHNVTLQEYECADETYDLIYSATAFHWIPEEYGYNRVYRLLKKGGAFARFAYHAGPDREQEVLNQEIQACYRKYMHNEKEPHIYCEEDARELNRVAEKYGFTDTLYQVYHFKKTFTADEYMMLLQTYPDHMRLEISDREHLFRGIYDAIERWGGKTTVRYIMDLQLARK